MRITLRSQKYTVRFNSKSLIEAFGGPAAVHRIFTEMGAKLSKRSVEQWRTRDNIPAEAVATLLLYAVRNVDPEFPIEKHLLRMEE